MRSSRSWDVKDFQDIYNRYLNVAQVRRWLTLREPVTNLSEYLYRGEDPILLSAAFGDVSEPGVKSPSVGDLYLVHHYCGGFALGITLGKQVQTSPLVATVQSVAKLKQFKECSSYTDRILVRRFAVDLNHSSKALEMLEYTWLMDGSLITQARFTVVENFPYPLTSHSEHRFWCPAQSNDDLPSTVYARLIIKDETPTMDRKLSNHLAPPCKFCFVRGCRTCSCPVTFRDRLGAEEKPIESIQVLTRGTWGGFRSVVERAQKGGYIRVRWLLGNSEGEERLVIRSNPFPISCSMGGFREISDNLKNFFANRAVVFVPPKTDKRLLLPPAEEGEAEELSSLLSPASATSYCSSADGQSLPLEQPSTLILERTMLPTAPASCCSPVTEPAVVVNIGETVATSKENFGPPAREQQKARVVLPPHTPESDGRMLLALSQLHRSTVSSPLEAVNRSGARGSRTQVSRSHGPRHGGIEKRRRSSVFSRNIHLPPVVSQSPLGTRTAIDSMGVRSSSSEPAGSSSVLGPASAGCYSISEGCETAPSQSTLGPDSSSDAEQRNLAETRNAAVSNFKEDLTSERSTEHEKTKQTNWKCTICGQTFKGKRGNLNRHYQVVHHKERRFVCQYPGCGQKFGYRLNEQRHYSNVHQSRKYKCRRCEKAFKTEEKLEIHVKVDHEKLEKPFICPKCGASFGRKSSLTRHKANLHGIRSGTVAQHISFTPVSSGPYRAINSSSV